MDPNKEYTLCLSGNQINYIVSTLLKLPYGEVGLMIPSIERQITAQVNPPPPPQTTNE